MLWVGLAATTVQAVTVLSLAVSGAGPLSLAWAQLASNLTSAIGNALCVPAVVGLRPSLRGWRRPLGFGGWLTASSIAGSIGTQMAELITGRVLAWPARRCIRVLSASRPGRHAVLRHHRPALCRFRRGGAGGDRRHAAVYLRFVAVITGLSWPAYAALAIWAEPITVLLYGGSGGRRPPCCRWSASAISCLPRSCPAIRR